MTLQRKLEVAGAIGGFVLLVVLAVIWVQERETRIRAEMNEQISKAKVDTLQQAQAQRDADTKNMLDAIEKLKTTVQTPQQVADNLPALIAGLNKPIFIQSPSATAPAAASGSGVIGPATTTPGASLPDAPSAVLGTRLTAQPGDLIVPKEDAKPLFDYIAKCKQDGISLNTCSQDLTGMTAQRDEEAKNAMNWKKVAKGGSTLHRLWTYIKIGGIAIGSFEIYRCAQGKC